VGSEPFDRLLSAALGGRVASSGFLDPATSSRLAASLRREGIGVSAGGGYPGAARRVVTAHPVQIPRPLPPFAALYRSDTSLDAVERQLAPLRVPAEAIGDRIAHREGVSLIVLDPPPPGLLEAPFGAERVPVERVAAGSVRTVQLVVAALRVDALGAKALRVSRSYFVKGIASGNVYLNGERVGKGGTASEGDELYADGLGWLRLLAVEGETRRGNLRVAVEVERSG
jgi:RNA-binding protein YlmH